jgi:protein-tyrosine phosphatase
MEKRKAEKLSKARLHELNPAKLLILCYGNIYRSPFVEIYLTNKLKNQKFTIKSAGFYEKEGRPSAADYVGLTNRYGVDLSHHSSSIVTKESFAWADAVIIMDGKNYKLSMMLSPESEKKLIWLGAFDSEQDNEICDPYGQSMEIQEDIVKRMQQACDNLTTSLLE